MSLQIHEEIYNQLDIYYNENRVPNIIFHGRNGSGKKTIVNTLIKYIKQKKNKKNMF